jgi:cytochrome b561
MSMVSRYHPALVVLHWALALLIIARRARDGENSEHRSDET